MAIRASIKSSCINRAYLRHSDCSEHLVLSTRQHLTTQYRTSSTQCLVLSNVCAWSARQCCQLLPKLRHIHRQVRVRISYQETCQRDRKWERTTGPTALGTRPPARRLQNVKRIRSNSPYELTALERARNSWNQPSDLPTSQHMVQWVTEETLHLIQVSVDNTSRVNMSLTELLE